MRKILASGRGEGEGREKKKNHMSCKSTDTGFQRTTILHRATHHRQQPTANLFKFCALATPSPSIAGRLPHTPLHLSSAHHR